jgi:hypothetical protein
MAASFGASRPITRREAASSVGHVLAHAADTASLPRLVLEREASENATIRTA